VVRAQSPAGTVGSPIIWASSGCSVVCDDPLRVLQDVCLKPSVRLCTPRTVQGYLRTTARCTSLHSASSQDDDVQGRVPSPRMQGAALPGRGPPPLNPA